MKKIDGRKLSTETQQQIRNTAIELYKAGKTYAESATILGVSQVVIWTWRKLYKEQRNTASLIIRKRGVGAWVNCKLNCSQMNTLNKVLIKYTPDKLGLGFILWTRQAIQNLISKLWRIKVSLPTVGRYMKKLGFTPQKPVKHAYEQNPKAVKKWIDEDYPKIVK